MENTYYFTFSYLNVESHKAFGIVHAESQKEAIEYLKVNNIDWYSMFTEDEWKQVRGEQDEYSRSL